MDLNRRVSAYLGDFLKDLAGGDDYIYELTCCKPETKFKTKFASTYRSKDMVFIAKKIEEYAPYRDIFISPFRTRYPEKSSDFVYNRQMISSNAVVIDIDSKEDGVDYKIVLKELKKHNIPKPTYLISSGSGCHLWYFLTSHIGQNRLRDIYIKIRNKIVSIEWPSTWNIDDLSIKQQFRVPFTINHKYDKIAVIVSRGDKIKVPVYNYIKPETYTKKELKRHRKLKKLTKVSIRKKPKISIDESSKKRFLQGSQSLKVKLKQNICVDQDKFKKIIQLLEYGKSYLSCRVAGEALNISYKAAAKFLKKCVAYGYLELFDSENSAYSYNIKVDYEIKKKESPGRCPITGPGQSNKAMCRLARQAYVFGLDKIETVKSWIHRFYHFTSGEHEPDELINTYLNVYEKFEIGKYAVFGST